MTPTIWTDIPKPSPNQISSTASYTGGEAIGLLLALTYSQVTMSSVLTSEWTDVAKPVGTPYTKVPKAT